MKTVIRVLTALVLISGIGLTISNGGIYMKAQLSGGGAEVIMHPAATASIKEFTPIISAVPLYEQATAADQMVLGILLILLGFFMHGLMTSHEERTVRVKAVPRKKQNHKHNLFWMEMRV